VFNVDNIVPGVIPVTLTGMKIQGGAPAAGIGGNIYNADESLTLDGVWVDSGSATGGGGLGMNAAGSLTIRNSTFSNNSTTTGNGAAVYITGATTITVSNSTFSGNNATGLGGALYGTATTANVTLNNSTIVYNSANGANGGGIYISGGTINIESTVVSDNSNAATPDIFASKVNSKTSLIGTADVGITTLNNLGGTISGTQLVPVSAQLNPLAINAGGKMQTHLPLAGSPLYNAGSNPGSLTTDQNGNTRVLQGAADIGSVESLATIPTASMAPIGTVTVDGATAPSTIVVTYSDDTAINALTFKNTNIELYDPSNNLITITGFSVDLPGNGTPRVVTYNFSIPGGSWDGLENGVYTIKTTATVGDQVTDTDGVPNAVPVSTIGTFTVAIPRIYTVDITTDDTPVTGKSTSATTGDLRWCIDQANTDGSSSIINFKGSVFTAGTKINLLQGELPVIAGVTINGPGAGNVDVVASPGARVFNVADTVTVTPNVSTISGMTISGGSVTGAGGGLLVNGEDLTLTSVTVSGNTASTGDGGGISLTGTGGKLSVVNSTVSNNRAIGGSGIQGGGINVAGVQDLVVTNSTVSGNSADEDGGGIYFFSGGSLTMTGSTVSGNASNVASTGAGGGGMYFWGVNVSIVNSTISGNNSNNNNGGGMVVLSSSTVTLKNSTLAFNNAGSASGGNISFSSGSVTGTSTLITGGSAAAGPDVNGAITLNDSLLGSSSGATVTGANNKLDVAAGLDATLKSNGGPTQTHALLAGSVAINNGSNPNALTTDQRGPGYNRVVGSAADIGAYEVQATPSKVTSVVINAGTANLVQRSRVTNLRVTFDNPVTIADVSKAFSLSKDGGGSVTLSTTLSGGNTVADIIFTGGEVDAPPGNQTLGNQSLVNGKYTFTITASEFSNGFDGGAGVGSNYALASTSYGGPGTPATGIFRVFGDATGNGKVESDDFLAFRLSFLGTNDWFDYNGNGSVDSSTDLLQFRLNFLQQV
jgi:hypothetical protein